MGFFSGLLDPGGVFSGEHGEQLYNPSKVGEFISPGGALQSMFDPVGSAWSGSKDAPDWLQSIDKGVTTWGNDIGAGAESVAQDRWKAFKDNPTQLLYSGGDPFSTRVSNGLLHKDNQAMWDQWGLPNEQNYQNMEKRGIDSSNFRGFNAAGKTVGNAVIDYYTMGLGSTALQAMDNYGNHRQNNAGEIAGKAALSYFGGDALNGAASGISDAAGVTSGLGQAAVSGAVNGAAQGGVSAATTGRSVGKGIGMGAATGAAGGALGGAGGSNVDSGNNGEWGNYKQFYDNGGGNSYFNASSGAGDIGGWNPSSTQSMGNYGPGYNVPTQTDASPAWMQSMGQAFQNPAGAAGVSNPMAQGLLNSGLKGAVSGAFKGNAGQGALQGLAGNAIGQGLGAFGNGNTTFGVNNQKMGSNITAGLMGLYGANQAKKTLDGQIGQLQGLFGQNSPYSQVMQEQLARKDAAAGRRSQGGQRSVELQARLAELNSRNAPMLNQLYTQRDAQKQGQLKDIYTTLRNTGILDKLGSSAQQYFQPQVSNPYKNYYDNGGQG